MSQENVEVVRRGWEAWMRSDMDALISLWDPDIVWDLQHFRNWPEGSYYGIDGVRRYLTEWREVWGPYEVDVDELLPAPDGRVVSLITHRAEGSHSGAPMVLPMALITTVRNGKIIRFDAYDDRAEALEAAGLSE